MVNLDLVFGAFWGAFFSFLFFIIPKIYKKINSPIKTRNYLNKLYDIMLFERNKGALYDLINILSFEGIIKILKGNSLVTLEGVQFSNMEWEFILINKVFGSRFSIQNSRGKISFIDEGRKDRENQIQELTITLEFLEYLKKYPNNWIYKIKVNKKRKEGITILNKELNDLGVFTLSTS